MRNWISALFFFLRPKTAQQCMDADARRERAARRFQQQADEYSRICRENEELVCSSRSSSSDRNRELREMLDKWIRDHPTRGPSNIVVVEPTPMPDSELPPKE